MPRSFSTPAAFKASLEARLKSVAEKRGVPINTIRLTLVIKRLLARLFAVPKRPWLLKGGYAMELRYVHLLDAEKRPPRRTRPLGEAERDRFGNASHQYVHGLRLRVTAT
jgi:hypothetical protein